MRNAQRALLGASKSRKKVCIPELARCALLIKSTQRDDWTRSG
jgi:hypothetical protein